ncbi:hypothetical protein [Mycobacterium sp. CnD-18-1]|uniref:hypothetical protein n=1 Tax=Mycobacterium sp. CnD-18-1 TaxID=2917744 RepID=UPI001EF19FB1|nr:hypothetical protein [Mycobacterium sp. CnD-18-1]MCG7608448.1 hypothetical protein [Mycobacterium sp. CnD-18-1]
MGIEPAPDGYQYFPFIRDFASWLLLVAIIIGLFLLHRQAQLMSRCLSQLADNGAIVARETMTRTDGSIDRIGTFNLDWISRVLLINRLVKSASAEDAFDSVVQQVTAFCVRLTKIFGSLVPFVAAAVIGLLLLIGPTRGFFLSLSPDFASEAARSEWAQSAYGSWWASLDHPVGAVVYFVYAIVAFLIVLSFQPVGFSVLYLIVAMRYTTQWNADWKNDDGCYGWRPVAEVYRTVLQAVSLLGVAVTVMLVMLGIQNFAFVLIPVLLYVCVAPFFVVLPRFIWRDVAETAKRNRINQLLDGISKYDIDNPDRNSNLLTVLQEVDRCRRAEIYPLRVHKLWQSTVFTAWIIPLCIATFQIVFPFVVHVSN